MGVITIIIIVKRVNIINNNKCYSGVYGFFFFFKFLTGKLIHFHLHFFFVSFISVRFLFINIFIIVFILFFCIIYFKCMVRFNVKDTPVGFFLLFFCVGFYYSERFYYAYTGVYLVSLLVIACICLFK